MPAAQLDLRTLWLSIWRDGGAIAPALVLAVYCLMQLGHALDRATEKLAGSLRRRAIASTAEGGILRRAALFAVNAFEFHVLGDYYTGYWPDHFRLDTALACVLVRWGGDEMLLPASVDFYFRRHVNAWVGWPREPGGRRCRVGARFGMGASGAKPGGAPGRAEEMEIDEVVRRIVGHLEASYVLPSVLARARRSGASFHLCVRGLEYHGTSLRIVRLWERPLPELGRSG